jgi:hypothetical protein
VLVVDDEDLVRGGRAMLIETEPDLVGDRRGRRR